MFKLNWKRAIIAGTVLTALCATAFAEEAPKPSIKERVNAILNEDNRPCPPAPLRGPKAKHHEEYFKHHHHGITKEEWDAKTPEERRQLHDQWRQEWDAKTPEEKAALREQWEKERLERMTPEQRERYEERQKIRAQREAERQERAKEKLEQLSPEQRAEVEAFLKDDMQKREEIRERMENMTPEQRDAIRANRGPAPKALHAGTHYGYRHHQNHRSNCLW